MTNLVVRNLDPRIVRALKQRAAKQGRSAEAEHRALLESVSIAGLFCLSPRLSGAFCTAAPGLFYNCLC